MSSRHGYKNPFILIGFPELAEGASVLIRNPRLMPPSKLQAIVTASEGADTGQILAAMAPLLVDLIVAWRNLYAADSGLDGVDLDADEDLAELMAKLEAREQEPLKAITEENITRLPMAVVTKIAESLKFGDEDEDTSADPTQP
jgi:hypothetical protein